MKRVRHPFDEAVVAETHSSTYLMHKYWARKPHNVVARYIEYYTDPGDLVLDPFMGSGVTIAEAASLGRRSIGIDLSPVACFIAKMTVMQVGISEFYQAFERLRDEIREPIYSLYEVRCENCHKKGLMTHAVWKSMKFGEEKLSELRVYCHNCRQKERRKPTDYDLFLYKRIRNQSIPYFYPKAVPLHSTAKRSVEFIHELFTHRALIALSLLHNAIQKESNVELRSLLMFTFTSTLAQVSRMPPFAPSSGISWKVPNYWVPPVHWEQNVWDAFAERFSKVVRGKKEWLTRNVKPANMRIWKGNATKLVGIESETVDYIFTDPPYGDAVPYFGLSLLWASWLELNDDLDFENEIIVSERGDYITELTEYKNALNAAFLEMFRVLKPNGTVTVTFHNREIRVWNALVSAAFDAGFLYENDNYVLPAVKSSKAQLAVSGTMTGDIYINFRRPAKAKPQREISFSEINQILTDEARMIIQARNGQATTDQLARGIYSHLIRENLFSRFKNIDIRELLSGLPIVEKMPNVWKLPSQEKQLLLAYIPLHKRIEFIVDSVLENQKKHGFELDEFLVPIFTQLKNGLTPDSKEILEVLRQRAEVKAQKWYPLKARQIPLIQEYEVPKKHKISEAELHEHEQFIYLLAQVGNSLGFQIWVGKNEQNKTEVLQQLSVRRLEIPGLSEQFISRNRIDQIDLIWLDPDEGSYVAFEIENSTGVVPGIQRLANLTESLKHLRIPTYVVIPDKFRGVAERIFQSPSGLLLAAEQRKFIVYSKLLHHIDLLKRKLIKPDQLLSSIAEAA